MSVARIRSIDFDNAGIADDYEREVQESGAKWIPEAEIIILVRTTDTMDAMKIARSFHNAMKQKKFQTGFQNGQRIIGALALEQPLS